MLYGTTEAGGGDGEGTVYKLNKDGSGYSVLHHFGLGSDGIEPMSALLEGSDGALYGTTIMAVGGAGAVFKLNKDGSGYTILHYFGSIGNDGQTPKVPLIEGNDGMLYGTTSFGGGYYGNGALFKLNKDGSEYSVIYRFQDTASPTDGSDPVAGLVQGKDGAFYGTTRFGGPFGSGVVFRFGEPPLSAQFQFVTNNCTITITKYTGANTEVSIPSTINGLPVTSIGDAVFFYCTVLTSVAIPSSVISIGNEAFCYCYSLTNVTIPDSVTSIGDLAFYDCTNLANITIPNSVTNIGTGAFAGCSRLTSVTIPNYITSIADCAFGWCYTLTSVTIPNRVTSIGDFSFGACTNLTNIAIPNSLTSIGDNAFEQCSSLTSLTIPDSVISIGGYLFEDCSSLTTVIIGNGVTNIPDGYYDDGCAGEFSDCYNLTNVTIGNSVTSIGDCAFVDCWSLTSVTIPNGVTSVGDSAFVDCESLTSVTFPDSVTSVGYGTFAYCYSLSNIAIPDGVTDIGEYAFVDCIGLTNITIGCGVNSIGSDAFESCAELLTITVNTTNSAYSSVDGVLFNKSQTTVIQCPGGKAGSYTIPNGITNVGSYAFDSCRSLTSVTIPDSVISIGDSAFEDCSGLTSVTIPSSVTRIGGAAFAYCTGLTGAYFQGNAPTLVSPVIFDDGYPVFVFSGDNNATVYYLPGTTGWGTTFGELPTALWNPQVQTSDPTFGVRTNRFGFNIVGTTNIPVAVEACTDLANPAWSLLQTCTLTNGSIYFSDLQWTNYSNRFYRIRSP
jgi:uncharacterized repeat protein (TIGR03803 family)